MSDQSLCGQVRSEIPNQVVIWDRTNVKLIRYANKMIETSPKWLVRPTSCRPKSRLVQFIGDPTIVTNISCQFKPCMPSEI